MHESFEPVSNVTLTREEHREKQASPSFSTVDGMQIDSSDESLENADAPMEET
jgi:hypothetical protein